MWIVETTGLFTEWLQQQSDNVRADIVAVMLVLESKGPMLGRPYVDTLYDSEHSNMKELRIQSGGDPYRAFFAFDPARKAIVLCAGNKAGNDKRFYKVMLPVADKLFAEHLRSLEK